MMKRKDMEGANPRYATKVEVADLRRKLENFMTAQDLQNKLIQEKLGRLSKLLDQANPCVEDLSSTSSVASTTEPLQSLHARCSTAGRCQDERTQELSAAVPTPSSTTNTFITALAKCSTGCSSQDKNALPPRNVVLRIEEELHKDSPTLIQDHVVLDDMQQRYIINPISEVAVSIVPPRLATRVWSVQKLEGMLMLNPKLPHPSPAIFADKEPEPYILYVERVNISPKPPCSVPCLEAESAQGKFNSQFSFDSVLWPPIISGLELMLSRQPWPPHIPLEFKGINFLLKCFTVSCVFDRGKSRSESQCLHTKDHVEQIMLPKMNVLHLVLFERLSVVLVDIPLKPPWSLVPLEDGTHSDSAIHNIWMTSSHLLRSSTAVLTDDAQLKPKPWPSFISNSSTMILGKSISNLLGDTCRWSLQHWLQFVVRYCGMQWDISWPIPMVVHQEKSQLVMVTVPVMQCLLQWNCPSLKCDVQSHTRISCNFLHRHNGCYHAVVVRGEVHEDSQVLILITTQCLVMLELLSATRIDIKPWPPPLKSKKTLPSATIKLDFSLGLPFNCDQKVVKHKPSWPPPLPCYEFPSDNAQPCLGSWQLINCGLANGQLFSVMVSWNSDTPTEAAVITNVPMIFQYSSKIEIVLQWQMILYGTCHISWVQAHLSLVMVDSVSKCIRRSLNCEFTFQCSGCQYLDWYLIQKNCVVLWPINLEMLQCLPCSISTISGATTNMHLQAFLSLVQHQQLSNVSFTTITVNQQLLTPWDPSIDPYFLDGCKSLDCLINLALIPLSSSDILLHIIKYWLSIQCFSSSVLAIAENTRQLKMLQHFQFTMQWQKQFNDDLATGSKVSHHLSLWDSTYDHCLLEALGPFDDFGYLTVIQIALYLVTNSLAPCKQSPSQPDTLFYVSTTWPVTHLSMAFFTVFQLEELLYFAYPPTDSIQVQGIHLLLNRSIHIIGVQIKSWPPTSEYSSYSRTIIAQLYWSKCEFSTDGTSDQTKIHQYLQINVVISFTTITNQQLILWDLEGSQVESSSLYQMNNRTAAQMFVCPLKLPMEHIFASSSILIEGILSSANATPFCAYHARIYSTLTRVAGILIIKLHCLIIDVP